MAIRKKDTKKGVTRLIYRTGCVCDALMVDGVEEIDMDDEQRQEVLNKIFESLSPEDLNYVLQALIKQFGEYESDDEPCECCGDIVSQYTWDLPKKKK